MSSLSSQLQIGQVVGNRYRIHSLIGRGGMGMVYAASHELTGRRVALKLMMPHADEPALLQERFLSEARIAAAVRHPNIVDVLDMGLHAGDPFLVMELLEGASLEQHLDEQRPLAVERALAWLFPIMGALAVLHEAGIVHRDVKPSNIFLSALPRHPLRPKLLDFGLARIVSDLRLTRSGRVIGTPCYMAPEHAAGKDTGPQADVWSLGVVLYECLAGVPPFNTSDYAVLATQVLAGAVRPLSERRPDLPGPLLDVVGRALQRELAVRYADMRSFARALHAAARACNVALPVDPDPVGLPEYADWQFGQGAEATRERFSPEAPDRRRALTSPRPESAPRASRRWGVLWLGGLATLALVAFLFTSRASERGATRASKPPIVERAPQLGAPADRAGRATSEPRAEDVRASAPTRLAEASAPESAALEPAAPSTATAAIAGDAGGADAAALKPRRAGARPLLPARRARTELAAEPAVRPEHEVESEWK